MKNTLLMPLHRHECSMLMLHQCIVAPLMQENLSFASNMTLYLNCGSTYQDLEDLVTILDLPSLLLHHLCFAHLYKASGNQYLVLFGFVLLVLILFPFVYTRYFAIDILPLWKFGTLWLWFACIAFVALRLHQRFCNRGFSTLSNLQVFLDSA